MFSKHDFEMFASIPLENLVPKLDPLGVDLLKVTVLLCGQMLCLT